MRVRDHDSSLVLYVKELNPLASSYLLSSLNFSNYLNLFVLNLPKSLICKLPWVCYTLR